MNMKEMLKTLAVIAAMVVLVRSVENDFLKMLIAFVSGDICTNFKMLKGGN